ncbi:hypothetical protein GCM10010916_39540 [Paenibacillus abyssi]|uniref:Uncharacterized protein n=1 Tax=Paenibacillus abyssi TaxID=1340531 RepID=A0A917G1Z8_9BACL|nr:hypothetical protein GCM10010916_39540 [Paenibacillus abyssi]
MKEVIAKILIIALVCSAFTAFIITGLFPVSKTSKTNISVKLTEKNVPQ